MQPTGLNFKSKGGRYSCPDYDARELAGRSRRTRARLVCRSSALARPELFALKRGPGKFLDQAPHVVEDEPAVCAWYPSARKALLWNLSEEGRRRF
jgi:hypothetical protein